MIKLTITILFVLFNFSVFGQNSITIISPNGGEIWQSNIQQTITWTDNTPDNVSIDLYKSDTLY